MNTRLAYIRGESIPVNEKTKQACGVREQVGGGTESKLYKSSHPHHHQYHPLQHRPPPTLAPTNTSTPSTIAKIITNTKANNNTNNNNARQHVPERRRSTWRSWVRPRGPRRRGALRCVPASVAQMTHNVTVSHGLDDCMLSILRGNIVGNTVEHGA